MGKGRMMPDQRDTEQNSPSRLYSIGDLADEFAISPRAIRFYEDQGLLAPARIGANRVYAARDRIRLRLILRGKRLGFSLSDIREMLDLYDTDRTEVQQLRMAVEKSGQRIADLEQQAEDIQITLEELRELRDGLITLLKDKGAEP